MFKKIFYAFVFCWCCTCLFVRCYMNLTGMETARTLGKGNKRIKVAGSKSFVNPRLFEIGDDSGMAIPEYDDPVTFGFDATFGIVDRLDFKIADCNGLRT